MDEIWPGETSVLDALAEGVIVVRGGRIAHANAAASSLVGAPVPDLLVDLTPRTLGDVVEAALSEGQSKAAFELGNRWIEAVARPLAEVAHGAVLVLRDVTDRRRLESVRRDFVADASHELKTPVASIQAAAETLVRALEDDLVAAQRFARQVYATASRLSQIVEDLLDLSRLETEQPALQELDLARLVTKELERSSDRAAVGDIDLVLDVRPISVRASRKDIRLAVRNLLENALAYTGPGGVVTVTVAESDAHVSIRVADTGVGIPGEDLPRIFERFYRVDDARNRETGGTGLGLSIVRHVAEAHGGTVDVSSEPGEGSTFTLKLPR